MSENSDRSLLNRIGHPGVAEVVAVSGTTAATAAALTEGATYLITAALAFHFAAAAAATTNSTYWPANVPLYITMNSAVTLAFIAASGATPGNLFVTKLNGYGV
jgi:hypothetical protein